MPSRSSQAPTRWMVIPVHNRIEVTRRCLAHLAGLGVPDWAHVLVVDDGSTDGTAAMIRAGFPWAEVLAGPGDWWWAGAIRAGMHHAIRHGAQSLCWLNDDTLPDPGALEALFARAEAEACLCGGLSLTHPEGPPSYGGGRMENRWPVPLHAAPSTGTHAVQWLHGNMVAIPRAVWHRLGLPDTRGTIHNYADIEYTYTAHRLGIHVLLVTEARAMAEANASASYLSWRDPQVTVGIVWRGFFSPKVWWYLPGLAAFKIRQFGWAGLGDCLGVLAKAGALPLHKAGCKIFRWHTLVAIVKDTQRPPLP